MSVWNTGNMSTRDHKQAMFTSKSVLLSSGEFSSRIEYVELPFAIKKALIRNIGPINNLALEFTSGLNVILGRGGSGKTTILRAFAEGRVEMETMLGKCILIDDPTRLLPLNKKGKLFGMIQQRFRDQQAIITLRYPQEDWILNNDTGHHTIFVP